jgi:hypothetical protein
VPGVVGVAGQWCEVPCHVYLERSLDGRAVIVTGRAVPYKNVWAKYGA